jgi:hypothetical protein
MTSTPDPTSRRSKPPHPGVLMKRIRDLATAGAYSWNKHVFKRRDERDIDIHDIRDVLCFGEIEGAIVPGVNPGEWKCKVTARPDQTSRRLGVVTVVIRNERLFLVTVEWEDTK